MHFYRQDTMVDPPQKYPVPVIYDLYTDPREEKGAADLWVVYPMLKIISEFEESLKKYPLIPMGTPDPYRPPGK
jgi:arylsulfatase